MKLTRTERAMLDLLELTLRQVETELEAAGPDEVKQHPTLRGKDQFVRRARKRIAKWKERS